MHSSALGAADLIALRSVSSAARLSLLKGFRYWSIVSGALDSSVFILRTFENEISKLSLQEARWAVEPMGPCRRDLRPDASRRVPERPCRHRSRHPRGWEQHPVRTPSTSGTSS